MHPEIKVNKTGSSVWEVQCLVPSIDGGLSVLTLGTFYDKTILDIFLEALEAVNRPSDFVGFRPNATPQAA